MRKEDQGSEVTTEAVLEVSQRLHHRIARALWGEGQAAEAVSPSLWNISAARALIVALTRLAIESVERAIERDLTDAERDALDKAVYTQMVRALLDAVNVEARKIQQGIGPALWWMRRIGEA
jgi:malonyl CoA-acyl carrier protein transacylase